MQRPFYVFLKFKHNTNQKSPKNCTYFRSYVLLDVVGVLKSCYLKAGLLIKWGKRRMRRGQENKVVV
jgi:hypothetical protein